MDRVNLSGLLAAGSGILANSNYNGWECSLFFSNGCFWLYSHVPKSLYIPVYAYKLHVCCHPVLICCMRSCYAVLLKDYHVYFGSDVMCCHTVELYHNMHLCRVLCCVSSMCCMRSKYRYDVRYATHLNVHRINATN